MFIFQWCGYRPREMRVHVRGDILHPRHRREPKRIRTGVCIGEQRYTARRGERTAFPARSWPEGHPNTSPNHDCEQHDKNTPHAGNTQDRRVLWLITWIITASQLQLSHFKLLYEEMCLHHLTQVLFMLMCHFIFYKAF